MQQGSGPAGFYAYSTSEVGCLHFVNNFIPVLHSEDKRLLSFPDCIHLSEHGRCDILTVSSCRGETCSFLQSPLTAKTCSAQWKQRLQLLDAKKQKKIAHKYYGGAMPWKE